MGKFAMFMLCLALLIILVTLALFPMMVPDAPTVPTPTERGLFTLPTLTVGPPVTDEEWAATVEAAADEHATAMWEAFYGYND